MVSSIVHLYAVSLDTLAKIDIDLHSDGQMSAKRNPPVCGLQGVRLKHFEDVLTRVLPSVQPSYVQLPPVPLSNNDPSPISSSLLWPFDILPDTARVHGKNPGQLAQPQRALRKEQQLQSMLRCIMPLIPTRTPTPPPISSSNTSTIVDTTSNHVRFTIVDFGGGSGHLAIPLALLLPFCRVVVVELNKKSLELMHQKVELVVLQILNQDSSTTSLNTPLSTMEVPPYAKDARFRRGGRNNVMENLFSFEGPVEEYTESFDMALALHLCGQATDVALRKAISVGATSMVVAPCCVGKLSTQVLNPDVYHATGQNVPTVTYPQSSIFCQLIHNPADWDALAKAADYSNEQESRTARNATRRTAKAVLETDRRLFLESHGYQTALVRMDPWEATPKNDIIVAWDMGRFTWKDSHHLATPDLDAQADVQIVMTQLLLDTRTPRSSSKETRTPMDHSDWTHDEEEEIHGQISDFLHRTESLSTKLEQVLVFPTRMGGRKRKLIHFVAHQLELAHWSVGEKDSEKTVAVARRGQNKPTKDGDLSSSRYACTDEEGEKGTF